MTWGSFCLKLNTFFFSLPTHGSPIITTYSIKYTRSFIFNWKHLLRWKPYKHFFSPSSPKGCTSGAKNKTWNVKLTTFELTSRGFSERMLAWRRRKSFSVVLALKSPKTWFIRKMLCNCLVLLLLFCYTDFLAELNKGAKRCGNIYLKWVQ